MYMHHVYPIIYCQVIISAAIAATITIPSILGMLDWTSMRRWFHQQFI